MKLTRLLLSLLLASPSVCLAELRAENLLQKLPQGYKIALHTKTRNMVMTEMIPQAETLDDWTEMVTTQVFLGMKNTTPEQFLAAMAKGWLNSCKDSEVAPVTKGEENGYAFSLWTLTCPQNRSSGKPEITWVKAIEGNDSFYVVQKAFRFEPSKEQVIQWMQYLRSVVVCDTRLADHPCPKIDDIAQ